MAQRADAREGEAAVDHREEDHARGPRVRREPAVRAAAEALGCPVVERTARIGQQLVRLRVGVHVGSPKSTRRDRPAASSTMLSSFTSRCAMRAACRYASASASSPRDALPEGLRQVAMLQEVIQQRLLARELHDDTRGHGRLAVLDQADDRRVRDAPEDGGFALRHMTTTRTEALDRDPLAAREGVLVHGAVRPLAQDAQLGQVLARRGAPAVEDRCVRVGRRVGIRARNTAPQRPATPLATRSLSGGSIRGRRGRGSHRPRSQPRPLIRARLTSQKIQRYTDTHAHAERDTLPRPYVRRGRHIRRRPRHRRVHLPAMHRPDRRSGRQAPPPREQHPHGGDRALADRPAGRARGRGAPPGRAVGRWPGAARSGRSTRTCSTS